jgi:6-phosphogluconolactonase (cycloisomerase 2 family)
VTLVYVGTYTEPDRGGRGQGVHVYAMDQASGELAPLQVVPGVANPHFLALHPGRAFLYSTNGGDTSAVSAFAIDRASGRLTPLNRQPSPGPGPTHLAVEPGGRWVVVANYAGGSVALYPLVADGRLGPHADFRRHDGPTGPNTRRQDGAHAHVAVFDGSGERVLVCDLGLDRTFVYRLDAAAGRLVPNDPPFAPAHPGAGPRHLAFHPSGRVVYVINELDSTISVFGYDGATGRLEPRQVAPLLPEGWSGENIAAEVVVHPSGRFVYGSNRGHDSIALFAVEAADGRLRAIGHQPTGGRTPRHFDLDPSGRFLYAANQDSDNLVVFRVDDANGLLTATGHRVEVGTPSCVLFA